MEKIPYGLHDSKISHIETIAKEIIFRFQDGVYELNEHGKEIMPTSPCFMKISLLDSSKNGIFSYIEIVKIRKRKVKEISWETFLEMTNQTVFDIDDSYISDFSDALLLKGYVGKFMIILTIENIKNITFEF